MNEKKNEALYPLACCYGLRNLQVDKGSSKHGRWQQHRYNEYNWKHFSLCRLCVFSGLCTLKRQRGEKVIWINNAWRRSCFYLLSNYGKQWMVGSREQEFTEITLPLLTLSIGFSILIVAVIFAPLVKWYNGSLVRINC